MPKITSLETPAELQAKARQLLESANQTPRAELAEVCAAWHMHCSISR